MKSHKPMLLLRIANMLWNEFIYGGHLCSLSAPCAVYAAAHLASFHVSWQFLAICYLGTESIYMLDHTNGAGTDANSNPGRSAYLAGGISMRRVMVGVFALGAFALVLQRQSCAAAIWTIVLLGAGLGYGVFFKGLTSRIPMFKDFFAACMFAALIPFAAAYEAIPWTDAMSLATLLVFIWLFIDIAVFDTRDLIADSERNIRTLAVVVGKRRCIRLLHWLNIVSGMILVAGIVFTLFPLHTAGLLLCMPYSYVYLRLAGEKQIPIWLFDVMIDGAWVTWLLFLWIGRVFV